MRKKETEKNNEKIQVEFQVEEFQGGGNETRLGQEYKNIRTKSQRQKIYIHRDSRKYVHL